MKIFGGLAAKTVHVLFHVKLFFGRGVLGGREGRGFGPEFPRFSAAGFWRA
jgi:hypothetical protein